MTDFCRPYPERLEGIAMLKVDDVDEACLELARSKKLGLVGAFIPVSPVPDKPYRDPIYERLRWTAQDLDMPLLLHIGTSRYGIPGNEFTVNSEDNEPARRRRDRHGGRRFRARGRFCAMSVKVTSCASRFPTGDWTNRRSNRFSDGSEICTAPNMAMSSRRALSRSSTSASPASPACQRSRRSQQ